MDKVGGMKSSKVMFEQGVKMKMGGCWVSRNFMVDTACMWAIHNVYTTCQPYCVHCFFALLLVQIYYFYIQSQQHYCYECLI